MQRINVRCFLGKQWKESSEKERIEMGCRKWKPNFPISEETIKLLKGTMNFNGYTTENLQLDLKKKSLPLLTKRRL